MNKHFSVVEKLNSVQFKELKFRKRILFATLTIMPIFISFLQSNTYLISKIEEHYEETKTLLVHMSSLEKENITDSNISKRSLGAW